MVSKRVNKGYSPFGDNPKWFQDNINVLKVVFVYKASQIMASPFPDKLFAFLFIIYIQGLKPISFNDFI